MIKPSRDRHLNDLQLVKENLLDLAEKISEMQEKVDDRDFLIHQLLQLKFELHDITEAVVDMRNDHKVRKAIMED